MSSHDTQPDAKRRRIKDDATSFTDPDDVLTLRSYAVNPLSDLINLFAGQHLYSVRIYILSRVEPRRDLC